MKVIIAGSRTISKYSQLLAAVAEAAREGIVATTVISGCASGVDKMGEIWAEEHDVPIMRFPARWSEQGRGAGMLRNRRMEKNADAAIILWDGDSHGTANMISLMQAAGKPVYVKLCHAET